MTNTLNKEECTLYSIEMPYRCCYIKYKNHGRCFPIDTSRNKNIYSTKYHIKAMFGYFDDGDVQIDFQEFKKKMIGMNSKEIEIDNGDRKNYIIFFFGFLFLF